MLKWALFELVPGVKSVDPTKTTSDQQLACRT